MNHLVIFIERLSSAVHVQIVGTSCVLRVMFFPKGFVGHDLALDSFQIFRDLEKFPTLNTQYPCCDFTTAFRDET